MNEEGLRTQLVFIDTSSYESKNFQFGQHVLGKIEEFATKDYITVLLPDVVDREIGKHIRLRVDDSLAAIKKVARDLSFLNSFCGLQRDFVHALKDGASIFDRAMEAYDRFKSCKQVEVVRTDVVDSGLVFDRYFSGKPPFENQAKKHEFPDAFALESIRLLAESRVTPIYVVSSDKDMKAYCGEFAKQLIYLERLDDFVGLVNKYEADLAEPAKIAEKAFDSIKGNIIEGVADILKGLGFTCDELGDSEYEVEDVDVAILEIESINVIDSEKERAEIELTVKAKFEASLSVTDYEESIWDPEDKCFVYIEQYEVRAQSVEEIQVYICLNYEGGLISNTSIDEMWVEESQVDLSYESVCEGKGRASLIEFD